MVVKTRTTNLCLILLGVSCFQLAPNRLVGCYSFPKFVPVTCSHESCNKGLCHECYVFPDRRLAHTSLVGSDCFLCVMCPLTGDLLTRVL